MALSAPSLILSLQMRQIKQEFAFPKRCHAEVLRSIWPACAIQPDASEYLSMTVPCVIIPVRRVCFSTRGGVVARHTFRVC
jgi:hypothetical protein